MRNLKARIRPTPEEALAVVAQTAPEQPPARMEVAERAMMLDLRAARSLGGGVHRSGTAPGRGLTPGTGGEGAGRDRSGIAPADLEDLDAEDGAAVAQAATPTLSRERRQDRGT